MTISIKLSQMVVRTFLSSNLTYYQIQSGLPRNLTAAIDRYGTASFPKAPAVTMLDHHGKTVNTLTYGKLHSKVIKVAYCLLNKVGTKADPVLRPGDKVSYVK